MKYIIRVDMCFTFKRRKEEALKKAKKLEKKKLPTMEEIKSEDKELDRKEAKLRKVFRKLKKIKLMPKKYKK